MKGGLGMKGGENWCERWRDWCERRIEQWRKDVVALGQPPVESKIAQLVGLS